MASTVLPPTLRFLTDAAHLLATSSPETSAFLMRQRNALTFEHEILHNEIQRQHVCNCCGHIMVLGRGSALTLDSAKKTTTRKVTKVEKPKGKDESQPRPGPTKVIRCGHCQKTTELKFPPPARISRHHVKGPRVSKPSASTTASGSASVSATAPPAQQEPPKPTANANSKKRAKSRKGGGLQALLEQSKASKGSGLGLGLSLADFMQK
ncbi:hypothetical protein OQA88_12383 [Cercophora sp. LCS_1]